MPSASRNRRLISSISGFGVRYRIVDRANFFHQPFFCPLQRHAQLYRVAKSISADRPEAASPPKRSYQLAALASLASIASATHQPVQPPLGPGFRS